MNIRPKTFSIKNLAQKAESLGHTIGKGLAQNKFGSRTVMRAANNLSEKAKDLKANFRSSTHAKTNDGSKKRQYTSANMASLKSSGLL